jgi:hypothetical protein
MGKKMSYVYTVKYYSALTKEGYPAVCNDMGEPDTLYAK